MDSILLPCLVTLTVLVVTLSVICKQDSRAQYYIKSLMLAAWHMFTALLVIPIAIFRPGDAINMWWWSFWVRILQTNWLFGFNLKKYNTGELLDYDGPCVIVCNHQTVIDQIVVLYVWPKGRSSFMAKSSLRYAGTFGIAGMLSGLIFVDRQNKEKAKSQTTKECTEFVTLKKGKLWVYPEGTRSGNRQEHMLPFKKGAFHIAVQAQVPIIPVVISAYKDKYSDKKKTFNSKIDMTLTVLPKVSTEGLTGDDVTSLSERVRLMMLETFYKTSPHIERPVTIETKENLETLPDETMKDNKTSSRESSSDIETLKAKTDELDKNVNVIDKDDNQESQTNVQSSHDLGTPNPADVAPPIIVENLQTEKEENQVKIENSTSPSANTASYSELSDSTLLVDLEDPNSTANNETKLEIKPKEENDDSPSSQASSDSFVFVNSGKLDADEEGNSAAANDTSQSNVREDVAQGESTKVDEIGENNLDTESNQKQDDIQVQEGSGNNSVLSSE